MKTKPSSGGAGRPLSAARAQAQSGAPGVTPPAATQQIQNPILRGFNPDPSIVRVGDDYYIATSTFEWFPGVQIHHSRVEIDYERLHFAYRVERADRDWRWRPQQFDASILSDEATAPGQPNFTGAFVGIACQDLAGTLRPADFDFFEYRERSYRADPFSAS